MTLDDIRNDILARIGSDTELQPVDLNRFINEGYNLVIGKILDDDQHFFTDTESITTVVNVSALSPTKNWIEIKLVQIDYGDGAGYQTLAKLSLEKVLDTNNQELGYCYWGDTLYISPTTDAGTLRIYGYVVPDDLTASETPAFNKILHPLLSTWGQACAIESHSSDTSFIDGQRKRQEFWSSLNELLPVVTRREATNMESLV